MKKIKLKSVFFKKLKGLNNVNIEFSLDTLTAIMGVNGSGKDYSNSCFSLCLSTRC